MMTTQKITATVEQIEPLTNQILRLRLLPQPFVDYEPGQYLKIAVQNQLLAYSIANASLGDKQYELHIRHQADPYKEPLFAAIKTQSTLDLFVPFGNCYLNRLIPGKPIVFIAGGTGFAPIKAMIEQLLATNDPRPFDLFWGARSQADLYLDAKVKQWQAHVSQFRYFSHYPKTEKVHDKDNDLVSLLLKETAATLKTTQIVIAGPFDMALMIRDKLVAEGINQDQLFSDAF